MVTAERSGWQTDQPSGLLRGQYRTLYIEPVPGSGERIAALVGVRDASGHAFKRIISQDAVDALFGDGAGMMEKLLQHALGFYQQHGDQFDNLHPLTSGLHWGALREAATSQGRVGLFRQALARCSAFGSLNEETADTAEVRQVKEGVYFAKRIREAVVGKEGNLDECFNVDLPVLPQGMPIRFGFVKGQSAANFEVLRPYSRQNSVKSAQGRLWQLAKAKKNQRVDAAWLILGCPPAGSVEHSEQQLKDVAQWTQELMQEGAGEGVTVKPVENIETARDTVLELAKAA